MYSRESYSYRVQLDGGQIWRRHVDDVLQNNPRATSKEVLKTPEKEATVKKSIQPVLSEASIPPQENSGPEEAPPTSASPGLHRPKGTLKLPQRLIKQI